LELLPGAADAVGLVNRRGWLAVVTTNQPQLAKGFVSRDDLETIHAKLETLLGWKGAKLDRIYYCPHHPDAGFPGEVSDLKVECECRKPKPGLILQAARDLPVDLVRSCLIGDSWRDAAAARAAGIRAYGVRTGNGFRGDTGEARPELMFSDVIEAVRFALDAIPERTDGIGSAPLSFDPSDGPASEVH
jgi:histidinol-phosphate phosphatase family protein